MTSTAEDASSLASESDYEYEYEYDSIDNDDVTDEETTEMNDVWMHDSRSYNNKRAAPCMKLVGGGERGRRKPDNNPNAAPVGSSMDMLMEHGSVSQEIRMLCSSEILPVMKHRLREVTEVLSIPASAAAVLLREHKWAKERLFETFYNDPEKLMDKCGVRARCRRVTTSGSACRLKSIHKGRYCPICCEDDFKLDEMLCMPCGHEFCTICWKGFAEVMVANGPVCVRTTCPQAGCTEAVTEEEVAIAAPELLAKFELYQLRSFVEMASGMRWCPGPGCTRVAMAGSAGLASVAECDQCTTCFCIRCGEEPHAPASCQELARWNEKCRNESETANWILANTKPCPKCQSRIEKNQGCNHMSCQQCKYEFCWICLASWSEHGANTGGYYKCNKFDPANTGDAQSDAARAKRELDRYLHYYKRYHAHSEAQKFAKKQLRDTEARMVMLQESTDNSTWTDVEFLKAATEQLVECRRVLKYTYTFAYYLTDKSKTMQKERFEHHQEMLEKFTENLSELSEKPLAEMDRTDVVNQTRVVDRFMKNVLKYVEDGMEED
jgi:ariadne-1